MTFQKAKDKLKKLAKGEYHTISFELTEHPGGALDPRCRMYIHGYGYTQSWATFELAWQEMKTKKALPLTEPQISEMIPQMEM